MIKLEIVTPEKKVFGEEVDQVTIPSPDGEITVLPHHLPVVTKVKPGELVFKKSGKTTHVVTGAGFAEITGKSVAVMTDLAQESSEIDEKVAQEAIQRAQEALKQRHAMTAEEFALTAANLEKALASLKVKRHHHLRSREVK